VTKINTEIDAFLTKYGKSKGISRFTISALKRFGVFDAQVLLVITEEEIQKIPNVADSQAQVLKHVAHEVLQGPLFQKGSDFIEHDLKNKEYCTTGSKNFDKLLDGGLRTGTLVEVAGASRSGKTQFCMTCAVTAQLPKERGGLNSPVIYIDTTNSFDVQHYLKIGERFGIEQEHLLENLFIVKADRLKLLKDALDRLPGYMFALNAKLVIIDSFIALYEHEHPLYTESEVLQKEFYRKLGLLKRLATVYNSVVLFTNHVIANPHVNKMFQPVIVAGGFAFEHSSDIRLLLKILRRNMRRMKIAHCSWLPLEYDDFYLTSRGVYDEDEYSEQQFQREKIAAEADEPTSPLIEGLKEIVELEVELKQSKSKNAQKKVK
jgi:RecA/RadA recombinase